MLTVFVVLRMPPHTKRMQVQLMIGEGSYGMLTAFVVSRVAPKVVHLVEHEVLYWYKSTCFTGTKVLAFVVSRVAPKVVHLVEHEVLVQTCLLYWYKRAQILMQKARIQVHPLSYVDVCFRCWLTYASDFWLTYASDAG